jgi:hypothetical protein
MALRMYWCVLSRQGTTAVRGKIVFRPVTQFSCEMDLGEGMGYTVRAAFLNGIRQAGGDEADTGVYRMDVYDDAGYSQILLEAFTVPPDAAVLLPAGSLAEYADDQILSELARRLGSRA